MIRLHNISKTFTGGHGGLHHVNLSIDPGEIVFVTGHSGAGKTTLFKLIAMIEQPTQGDLFLNGHDISHIRPSAIAQVRRQMGLIFQNPYLLDHRSILDNVALPLLMNGFRVEEAHKRASAALDKVGLHAQRDLLPRALSMGEQQRVGIARAVVSRPAIVLADEPTGNVDPGLALEMMRVFEAFNAIGVTILLATHNIQLAHQLGHRIIVLEQGKVVSDGS